MLCEAVHHKEGRSLGPVAKDPGVEILLYPCTAVKLQIILLPRLG